MEGADHFPALGSATGSIPDVPFPAFGWESQVNFSSVLRRKAVNKGVSTAPGRFPGKGKPGLLTLTYPQPAGASAGYPRRKECEMVTRSIKVDRLDDGGCRAVIRGYLPETNEAVEYRIKYPRSRAPYFMAENERQYLKSNELKALREAMRKVGM